MRASMRPGLLPMLLAGSVSLGADSPPAPGKGEGRWIERDIVSTWDVGDGSQPTLHGRLLAYLPKGHDGKTRLPLVIALPGYGHPPEYWRDSSCIAPLADRFGVFLAIPDMGKTVYETRYYPETERKWSPAPGLPWLLDVVLPYVRSHFIVLGDARHTAILGYSTGGRGAVMACAHSNQFGFCASLSGTYDLMTLDPTTGEYRIHAFVYGERDKFPERWRAEGEVLPEFKAALQGVPIFLAHGSKDPIVDPAQQEAMKKYLSGFHSAFRAAVAPDGGHDWAFWNSQLPAAFEAMKAAFAGRPLS